jgi:hypothetical protein
MYCAFRSYCVPFPNPLAMTGMSSAVFEIRYVTYGRALADANSQRLDSEPIVLHGLQSEAADQVLKGILVLHLNTPLSVDGISLRMTGQWKIG